MRLKKDIQELISHDFSCSAASLQVSQSEEEHLSGYVLNVCIHEGPYRGGHFVFYLDIPYTYPFNAVNIFALHRPIWHPNVELLSGRVSLPMEWTPVITLTVVAVAIQMILLEPNHTHPLNIHASSCYASLPTAQFEAHVQHFYQGCLYENVEFVDMGGVDCQYCKYRSEAVMQGVGEGLESSECYGAAAMHHANRHQQHPRSGYRWGNENVGFNQCSSSAMAKSDGSPNKLICFGRESRRRSRDDDDVAGRFDSLSQEEAAFSGMGTRMGDGHAGSAGKRLCQESSWGYGQQHQEHEQEQELEQQNGLQGDFAFHPGGAARLQGLRPIESFSSGALNHGVHSLSIHMPPAIPMHIHFTNEAEATSAAAMHGSQHAHMRQHAAGMGPHPTLEGGSLRGGTLFGSISMAAEDQR